MTLDTGQPSQFLLMAELGEYAWSWTALATLAQYFQFKVLVISCLAKVVAEEICLVVGQGPFPIWKGFLNEFVLQNIRV